MFKKKILSTLLAVGLSATFLVGCGAGDEGTASNSDKVNVKLLVTGAPVIQSLSVQFSSSVVSNSLQPHRLQHARPPCISPGVYSNSCPSCR